MIDDIRYTILSRKISILCCGGAHTAPTAHIMAVGPGGKGEDSPPQILAYYTYVNPFSIWWGQITEDGSVKTIFQIIFGQYYICESFGGYMC